MILFPAIDIKDNQCVRLIQGDFNKAKVYCYKPSEIARLFENDGAKYLHIVDLNGANKGVLINLPTIKEIIKQVNIPIQVGGGIRNIETVKTLLDLGVNRVIVGTMAIEDEMLLKRLVDRYQDKIVVSIDAKNGYVATRGWKTVSEVASITFLENLEKIGVKTIVYTDILKDGMLEGPNFNVYEEIIKKTNLNLIASGGVSTLSDLKRLKKMGCYGAIVGKALYEKKFILKEGLSCLQNG